MSGQILQRMAVLGGCLTMLLPLAGWGGCAARHVRNCASGGCCPAVPTGASAISCSAGPLGIWHAGYHGTCWHPLVAECGMGGPTPAVSEQPVPTIPGEEVPPPMPSPVESSSGRDATNRLPPATRNGPPETNAIEGQPVILPSIRESSVDPFEKDPSAELSWSAW